MRGLTESLVLFCLAIASAYPSPATQVALLPGKSLPEAATQVFAQRYIIEPAKHGSTSSKNGLHRRAVDSASANSLSRSSSASSRGSTWTTDNSSHANSQGTSADHSHEATSSTHPETVPLIHLFGTEIRIPPTLAPHVASNRDLPLTLVKAAYRERLRSHAAAHAPDPAFRTFAERPSRAAKMTDPRFRRYWASKMPPPGDPKHDAWQRQAQVIERTAQREEEERRQEAAQRQEWEKVRHETAPRSEEARACMEEAKRKKRAREHEAAKFAKVLHKKKPRVVKAEEKRRQKKTEQDDREWERVLDPM